MRDAGLAECDLDRAEFDRTERVLTDLETELAVRENRALFKKNMLRFERKLAERDRAELDRTERVCADLEVELAERDNTIQFIINADNTNPENSSVFSELAAGAMSLRPCMPATGRDFSIN